jgi:hypothetical protein
MTKARSNATAEAAKGDLRAGTGTNLSGILAVGSNGETLVADSSTSTGLRYQAPVNFNPVLNSAMQVWQRGTSPTFTANNSQNYQMDRWAVYSLDSGRTITRQVTGDTTNLPFIQYCARVQRTNGSTLTSYISPYQPMESINSIPFAGKTVTFSFYARRGANYSAASNALNYRLVTGTGTDENIIYPGYTGNVLAIDQTATLTTTWQRFSYTATLNSTITEITPQFIYQPVGTAGAADYFEFTGVQIEVGSVATPFKTYAGTLQGELAACQRYYQLLATGTSKVIGMATALTGSTLYSVVPTKVSMRTAPTISQTTGTNYYGAVGNAATDNFDSFSALSNASPESFRLDITSGVSLTAGYAYWLESTNASAFLAIQAEL